MLIVRYGSENGKNFYIVKNSRGPCWGHNGFGKVWLNPLIGLRKINSIFFLDKKKKKIVETKVTLIKRTLSTN